jgi:hypothetical protein
VSANHVKRPNVPLKFDHLNNSANFAIKTNQENEPRMINSSQSDLSVTKPAAPSIPPPPPPPPPPLIPLFSNQAQSEKSPAPVLPTSFNSANSLVEQEKSVKSPIKTEESKTPIFAPAAANMDFLTEIRMKFGKINLDVSSTEVDNDSGMIVIFEYARCVLNFYGNSNINYHKDSCKPSNMKKTSVSHIIKPNLDSPKIAKK